VNKSFSTLNSAAILIILAGVGVGVREGFEHLHTISDHVAPGENFFAYANRDWLAEARIPPGKGRWGAREEIAATSKRQVAKVIREAGNWVPAYAGTTIPSTNQKVADFFSAYLDTVAIETKSAAPLKASLEEIDRIASVTDLSRYLGAHLRADVDPVATGVANSSQPIGFAASYGMHGEASYVPYLTQGGLGLGGRDAYLEDTATSIDARKLYEHYVGLMLAGAGFDDTLRRAKAIVALETAISRTHATAAESSNDANIDNYWARGDFGVDAPGLDWRALFEAAGVSKERNFVVWQPGAIKGTSALAASTSISTWKDYLRFHVLDHYAEVLPQRFSERAKEFHQTGPRRQRAIEVTSRTLVDQVARLYVARFFPPEEKARVQAILDHVVAASKRRVSKASWMSPEARQLAVAKLDAMYFGVGYPEAWPDDSALAIDPHDAFGNVRRVEAWRYKLALSKLGTPTDRREWAIAPQVPGALLNFQLNSYNFAAALLQVPKFDPAASEAANYGAIGAIFAHEVTHFVDTLGADYDAQGGSHNWWTPREKESYAAMTQPLVGQYAAYRPVADIGIDGTHTLVENFADLSGLDIAFDAYREALGTGRDADALKAQDQEFFLGFARAWRATLNDDGLRTMLKGDTHAPEAYRVATVRNMDAWYEAFGVQPGDRLYVPPKERVHVW
jgi:putative endopeptidase